MHKKFFLLLTIIGHVEAMQHPAKDVAGCSGFTGDAASTFSGYRRGPVLSAEAELIVKVRGEEVQIPAYLVQYSDFLQTHCSLKEVKPIEITEFNSDMMSVIRDILVSLHEAISSGALFKDVLQEYLQDFDPSELESIYYTAQFFRLNERQVIH